MTYTIDQLARDEAKDAHEEARFALSEAREAKAMISAHEQVCIQRAINAEGWRTGVDRKLDGLGSNVRALYNRNWAAAVGFILLLLGVIGYLINKHGI